MANNSLRITRNYGYDILINIFEPFLRKYIANDVFLINYGKDWKNHIPQGVMIELSKIKEIPEDCSIDDFFEELNFINLKDILIAFNNLKLAKSLLGDLSNDKFTELMDNLNVYRRKIAHAKSTFSEFDLITLIEQIELLCQGDAAKEIKRYLKNEEYKNIKEIPPDFFEEYECQNNLPRENYDLDGGFVGRTKEIQSIRKLIKSDQDRIITITGAGGVGKTAIALKVAYSFLPDSQNPFEAIIWFSAKTSKLTEEGIVSMTPEIRSDMQLIEDILSIVDMSALQNFKSAKVPPDSYKTYLYKIFFSQKCLLIIDNLETIIKNDALISFIKDIPRPSQVLITSRKGLGEIERRYPLGDMLEKDAILLFRIIAKERNRPDLVHLKDETISDLVKRVRCYPLLIKWSIGQICLGKEIDAAFSQILEGDSEIAKFSFNDVFSLLSENAKNILFSMIIHGEKTVSRVVLMHITNLSDEQFEDVIKELVITSFVFPESKETESGVVTEYAMLALTRGFIENKFDENETNREMLLTRYHHLSEQIQDFEASKSSYSQSLFSLGIKTPEEQVAFNYVKAAKNFYNDNDIENSEKNYEKAIKIAPKLSYVMTEYSKFEFARGHIDESLKLANRAKEVNPESYHAWFHCGIALRRALKTSEALICLQKAKELNSKHLPIYAELGKVYTMIGEYEKAEKEFKDALIEEKYPNYRHKIITLQYLADNYLRSSFSFEERGDKEGQIEQLRIANETVSKALEINSKDKKLWNLYRRVCKHRGIALCKHRGFSEGKQYLEECLKTIRTGNIEIVPESKIIAEACYYLVVFSKTEKNIDSKQIENLINMGIVNSIPNSRLFDKLNYLKKEILGDNATIGIIDRKFGSVKFYNSTRFFGVIETGNETYLFFISGFRQRLSPVELNKLDGKVVSFTLIESFKIKDEMIATDIIFEGGGKVN